MTLTVADHLATLAFSAVGGGAGAFLVGYLRRKGENLATHEDIHKLVDQVKVTTAVAEAIKSEVTGQQWVNQERWKHAVDLYITILSILDSMASDHLRLAQALRSGKHSGKDAPVDIGERLQYAMVRMQLVNPGLVHVMQDLRTTAMREGETQADNAERSAAVFRKVYLDVAKAARGDLGFDSDDGALPAKATDARSIKT
jgi:hypothetical protein